MARSMTGYGRSQETVDGLDISAEIKSVNHKYFEASVRLPRNYLFLEDKIKTSVQAKASRGKIEIFVNIKNVDESGTVIEVDREYTDAYVAAVKQLSKIYGLKYDLTAGILSRNPDVFKVTQKEMDEEKVVTAVISVVNKALDNFVEMRCIEGKRLADDVLLRLGFLEKSVSLVEEKSPETIKAYRERLENKIKELLDTTSVDENRIITETAIFADRIAVDEETVRLKSHIKQVSDLLSKDIPIGRKLDFIVQEMNRETNTIGSKAQNTQVTQTVVDMKSEIEKIREQIQNIE